MAKVTVAVAVVIAGIVVVLICWQRIYRMPFMIMVMEGSFTLHTTVADTSSIIIACLCWCKFGLAVIFVTVDVFYGRC